MSRMLLRWLIAAVLIVVPARMVAAETVAGLPAPAGYVDDFAGVLSAETRQQLEDLCTEVDHQAHAQIAVVTVKSMDADASGGVPSIEEFAIGLEDKWKVGKKGTDRGVLVIVSLSPRKYRIEVGYGLEGVLNDAKVGDIGRQAAPYLHANDYNQGVTVAVDELAQDIAADAGVTLTQGASRPEGMARDRSQYPQQQPLSLFQVLLFGGIAVVVLGVLIRTGHIGWLFFLLFNLLGGGGGGGRGGGGGFGGGDGGGGGGGFGGFGGGSSGGGGASGDF